MALILVLMCVLAGLPIEALGAGRLFGYSDISKVASAPPAAMFRANFTHRGVTRSYAIFSPPATRSSPGPRPLLVLLHGCLQNAEDFAELTRMNEIAIRENAFVLYPEQSLEGNPARCWNWFDSSNQKNPTAIATEVELASATKENGSELGFLIALIESLTDAGSLTASIDAERVYLLGFSAGAAMAANLMSCRSELFASAGFVAGISFGAAQSLFEAQQVMKFGSRVSPESSSEAAFECSNSASRRSRDLKAKPILLIHGEKDRIVHKRNSAQLLRHFEALFDRFDDQQLNQSFAYTRKSLKNVPAKRGQNAHRIETLRSETGFSARLVEIRGLGHAWSGSPSESVLFSEPKAPAATEMIWQFFLAPESVR